MLLRVRTALRALGLGLAVLSIMTLAGYRFPGAQRLPRFVVMQPLAFSWQSLRTQRIVGLRFGQHAWFLPGPLVLPFNAGLALLALGWVAVEVGSRRWSWRWSFARGASSAPPPSPVPVVAGSNGPASPPGTPAPRPARPVPAGQGAATLVPIPAEADELERGITRLEVGDPRGAIAILEPLLGPCGNKELVRYYLVFAYAKDQQPDKVRATMVALKAGALPAARRYKLAVALDQARLYDLALALYEQLLPEHGRFSQVVERHKRVREIMFEGGAEAFDRQLVGMLDRRYTNAKVMASGGMGVVFSAWEDDPGRKVAIKMLSPFMRNDEEAVKRFLLEGKTLSELNHVNLVRTYHVHTAPCPHYSMELLTGMTLAEVISRQSPLAVSRIRGHALQLLNGLAYCHERGVLHRDIKPANVLVPEQGPLKIIDFGLVRLAESTGITIEGTVLGTPAYMPPEQLKGNEVDVTADLYSFGVCLYELATGRLPFPVGDQMTGAIMSGTFAPAAALRHELPPELDLVLARLIQPDRGRRPRSAVEVAEMVGSALPG